MKYLKFEILYSNLNIFIRKQIIIIIYINNLFILNFEIKKIKNIKKNLNNKFSIINFDFIKYYLNQSLVLN